MYAQYGGVEMPFEPAKSGGWHSVLRSGNVQEGRAEKSSIWELIFLPWLCLALIFLCFMCSDGSGLVLIISSLLLLALAMTFMLSQNREGKTSGTVLGMLCAVACIVAFLICLFAFLRFMMEWNRIERGATYHKVYPSEQAATRNDATIITFAADSTIDVDRTYGYADAWSATGTVYCVAPVSASPSANERINYFAAGTNCCDERSNFQCGDARNQEAIGGIVIKDIADGYRKAIDGSSHAYGITVGTEFLLLRWTNDPVNYHEQLKHHTVVLLLVFSGVYLLLSCVAGLAINQSFKDNR